ncbi:MAG: hypothetical protein ASARMPREDX12_007091 [Alectoria sarmentosa]|nr:MAG: hypothetical protein ASARMPREDX12_007091 [Alectoria sarmentosa]
MATTMSSMEDSKSMVPSQVLAGNAQILNSESGDDLLQQTKISPHQYSGHGLYSIVLTLFYISYSLFEVPSNYYLKRVGPSKWIAFIMFCWGVLTIGSSGVTNFSSLAVTRLLLGIFEAGMYPGLVFYLTFWYRPEERSLRIAIFLASASLAGAFGGSIAYAVGHMNGVAGLVAWRWLFILEGIPSCLLAIVILLVLPDYPESARWLNAEEKTLAADRMKSCGSKGGDKAMTWDDTKKTLIEWRLYAHYLLYFLISAPFSSLSLFIPAIVSGLGYTSLNAQLMTIPPYAVAYVVTLLVSWSADRFNSRALHAAACALIAAVGFIGLATLPPDAYLVGPTLQCFPHRYGMLVMSSATVFASTPPLLSFLASNTHSTASTGLAVALNVTFGGGPGLLLGVWIYKPKDANGGYKVGNWVNAAFMLGILVICSGLRWWYGRINRSSVVGRKYVL